MRRFDRVLLTWTAALALFVLPGCIVISGGYGGCGARAWREATEEIQIDSTGLAALEVRGHNGKLEYRGEEGASPVRVVARKRGGSWTGDGAEAALAAIEVFVEDRGAGVQRVGWRWSEDRHRHWQGSVDFSITGPASLDLDVETHNGEIVLAGVVADVKAVTHNGGVNVDSSGRQLHAESHNGGISAKFAGDELTLSTHNGGINARLTGSGPVGGTITTHNGGVEVAVGDGVAAELRCSTQNGSIKLDVPNQASTVSSRLVKATIGQGGPPLAISTHNGGVRVRPSRS